MVKKGKSAKKSSGPSGPNRGIMGQATPVSSDQTKPGQASSDNQNPGQVSSDDDNDDQVSS
jgi:hypothetical protein